jgi:hypothetical protein
MSVSLKRAGLRAGLVLGTGIFAVGCVTGARMQPPKGLVGKSEVLEVAERAQFGRGLFTSEAFHLGPYRVSDVDRDWNKIRRKPRQPW